MATYSSGSHAFEQEKHKPSEAGDGSGAAPTPVAPAAPPGPGKYRGATVEDLDPPPALSTSPESPIAAALQAAFERDYTHLTVVSSSRALLGYLSIPRLRELLQQGSVTESDPVAKAMLRFRRKGSVYTTITMETPLEELERFFDGGAETAEEAADAQTEGGGKTRQGQNRQDFAVVTDRDRKFVLGVATREDLDDFVKRRPTA
ncbi:hypothetical protein KEM52_004803 [Ascosphaera acerosa]|nr:hypothetical protein KEM52_004803 [Ascosphaera acerosa]